MRGRAQSCHTREHNHQEMLKKRLTFQKHATLCWCHVVKHIASLLKECVIKRHDNHVLLHSPHATVVSGRQSPSSLPPMTMGR